MNTNSSKKLANNKNIFIFSAPENTFAFTEFCLELLDKNKPQNYKIIYITEQNIAKYIPDNNALNKLDKYKNTFDDHIFYNYLAAVVLYHNGGLFLSPNTITTKDFSIPDFLLLATDIVMFSDPFKTPCNGYILAKQGATTLVELIKKYETTYPDQITKNTNSEKQIFIDPILENFAQTKTKEEILLLDSEKYGYLAEKSIFGLTGKHIFQNYYFTNKCPLDEFFTTTKGTSFLQEYYIPEIFQKMSKSEFEKQNILLTKILKK